jgi:hypothetical protein
MGALVFGVLESVVKGNGAGVRDGIGNLSAPWIILPLLASAAVSGGRVGRGAVTGLGATLAGLTGFYLANAFILDLGPHSTLHDIGLTLNVGSLWFRAGALSGPLMGMLGAWASRTGGLRVAMIGALAMLLEPVVVYLYVHLRPHGAFAAGNGDWNGVYAAEGGIGLAAVLRLWRLRTRARV